LIKQNNNRYKFTPVVFIDIIGNIPPAKLVRVPGIIHDIDAAARQFTLCFIHDDVNVLHYDSGSCITVSVSRNTSLVDADRNGRPLSFEALKVRDRVTAIGFFSGTLCAQYDNKDLCKVLDAVVIERGEFEKIKGTILSPVDMTTEPYAFDLKRDPGQLPPVTGDEIKVLLQDDTKIFSVKHGELVNASSLEPGDPVEIDGIYLDTNFDSEPDVINAVFILVDLAKKLSGTIFDINYITMTFNLSPINKCVQVPDYAQIYLINKIDNSSEIVDILGLSGGMQTDVYGYEYDNSGCLKAKSIIAFE